MEDHKNNSLYEIIAITFVVFVFVFSVNILIRKYSYLVLPYFDSGFSEAIDNNKLADVISNNPMAFNVGENLIVKLPKDDGFGQRVLKPRFFSESYFISDNMDYLSFFGFRDRYFYININGEYINLNKLTDEGKYTYIDDEDVFFSNDGKSFALRLNTPKKDYVYINGHFKDFSNVSNLALSPKLDNSFISTGREAYIDQEKVRLGYDIRRSIFSPDGNELFLWGEKKNSQNSYMVLHNSGQKFLSNTYEPDVFFSEDGSSYAFRGSEGSIFDNKYHVIFNGKSLPNYEMVENDIYISSDGKKVAYFAQKVLHGEDWWLVVDGKEYGPYKGKPRDFVFSDDAKNFAYSIYNDNKKQTTVFENGHEVFVVNGYSGSLLYNPINGKLVSSISDKTGFGNSLGNMLFVGNKESELTLTFAMSIKQIEFDSNGDILVLSDTSGSIFQIVDGSGELMNPNMHWVRVGNSLPEITHIFMYEDMAAYIVKDENGEFVGYRNEKRSGYYDKIIEKSLNKDGKLIFLGEKNNEVWSIVIEE